MDNIEITDIGKNLISDHFLVQMQRSYMRPLVTPCWDQLRSTSENGPQVESKSELSQEVRKKSNRSRLRVCSFRQHHRTDCLTLTLDPPVRGDHTVFDDKEIKLSDKM